MSDKKLIMKKYVPLDKMSKKNKKLYLRKHRKDWRLFNPTMGKMKEHCEGRETKK
jgi:hypothetical protein